MRDSFAALLRTGAGKLALSLLVASSSTTAFTFTPVPSPNLNLNDLGRIAFAGDFDSISLYQYEGQSQQFPGRTGALLSRYPNGVFATINVTDADIKSMCALNVNNTERVVFAGNFTSVGKMQTPGGIALLNPDNGAVTALEGLDGSVNTLFCDQGADQVYVGGALSALNSTNALIWKNGWQDLTFNGFNGPIHSIARAPNGNIIFGGEFNGLGGNTSAQKENNTQVIPISNANISAQTSSGLPGFTQPNSIACKSDFTTQGADQTWLLANTSPGFWKADFGFGFEPTRLRLFNTDFEGRGTKTWRFTALPDGGIMNFTYTNSDGNKAFCDATCPLPEGDKSGQDFEFVNVVGMNSFRIDISDWYGNGAGLNGIELFQDAMFSYAINDFNEPEGCGGTTSRSRATTTGPWQVTPSHNSNSQYLTAVVQGDPINTNAATVTFFPDLKQSGNYSVTIYTPGCEGDGTCGSRGRVNVTSLMSGDEEQVELWQTNNFDKYDEVYRGFVDIGSNPSVVLRAASGQGGTPLTMVAQRVRFTLIQATTGNLNGIFEYEPGQEVADMDLSASVINTAGATLEPRDKAPVMSLATSGDELYVGGNFSSSDGRNNIFSIRKDSTDASALPGNGLNNQVMTIFTNDSTVYVGGNFTNTVDNSVAGLNGVAALVNGEWRPLGRGVDGVVLYLVPFSLNITANTPEQVLAVSGFFSNVNGWDNNPNTPVNDFAVWVPSRGNWLHNLDFFSLAMSGRLMTYADVPGGDRWFGGSVSSGALLASGTAELQNKDNDLSLRAFPIDIQAQQQQPQLAKRAIVAGQDLDTTGVRTGTFYRENGSNKTILAGHFATKGTNDQNITNVIIIDGNDSDNVSGFGDELDANSTFAVVAVKDNILYAGGAVTGELDNDPIAGIVAYNLNDKKFATIQPPPLQGDNATVNAIAPRPNSKDIYVGGSFELAGDLSCAAVCVWNTERNQWTSPGNNLNGNVTSMVWVTDNRLIIAGNITSGPNTTTIMSFDSSTNQFAIIAGADELPGPVTALTIATSGGDELWAAGQTSNGEAFLQRFNGEKWMPVNEAMFGDGTDIRGIQVVSLSEDHGDSRIIASNQDLLLMGQINITDFGTASAALFNGSDLIPFLLATKGQDGSTEPGSLSSIFVENPNSFFQNSQKHLALWAIVLIGLAIALVLTFLLVVAGIVLEWFRKRSQGYSPAPQSYPQSMGNVGRLPPEQLFGTLSGPRDRAPAI